MVFESDWRWVFQTVSMKAGNLDEILALLTDVAMADSLAILMAV